MDRLVVDGYGKYVGKKSNRIVVREQGKTVFQAPPEGLRQVLVTGKGSIGFDAVNLLAAHGVDLIFIDSHGEVRSRLSSPEMRTVATRREQYFAYKDFRGFAISKAITLAKLRNQQATLGTLAKRRKETDSSAAEKIYAKRERIQPKIAELENMEAGNVEEARESIMGIEGSASLEYWSAITQVVPKEYGFNGRSGRYATDPVNAMLNYGYGVLEGETWRAVHFAGLDPYGGFLHVDRPGKPSLVLDLMEEFRQQLVDKSVIKLISRKEVDPANFIRDGNACAMDDKARRTLLMELLGKLEEYTAYGDEKVRWCDIILNQARNIGKYLRGEVATYEGFWLRW
ncbi:MAG: CRISPR-associated endonuclease Cas1 [Candidatus Brockarchaeota archaeon]|nr:CRISPR-associated endonuclease Cas1 [Candidatus Brockarchaeota archaeon]